MTNEKELSKMDRKEKAMKLLSLCPLFSKSDCGHRCDECTKKIFRWLGEDADTKAN